jgi:hypothetical protein
VHFSFNLKIPAIHYKSLFENQLSYTLKKISVLISVFLLLTTLSSFAQDAENITPWGTYGRYIDYSTYTELKLNCDSTFEYIDRFELGSTYRFIGTWRIKNNKVILNPKEEKPALNLNKRWLLKENKLKGHIQSRNPKLKSFKIELIRKQ